MDAACPGFLYEFFNCECVSLYFQYHHFQIFICGTEEPAIGALIKLAFAKKLARLILLIINCMVIVSEDMV